MAEVRPFRGLRYSAAADPSLAIAPPYDVISPAEQRALYERSPYNVVRIEYGEQRDGDGESDNRYTRAAADLARWRADDVLALDDAPAIFGYRQQFSYAGRDYSRQVYVAAVRLEEWEKGVVKPHEHTLANPKADRLSLLRATRTQISPVYSLFRPKGGARLDMGEGATLADFEADDQRHHLTAIKDDRDITAFTKALANSDVYIADGHHRYETALAYRDERRTGASSWTGDEPENFVLMGLTAFDDPGLLVLPTHRLVRKSPPTNVVERLSRRFRVVECNSIVQTLVALSQVKVGIGAFGLEPGKWHLIVLEDENNVVELMPRGQPEAWKRLDVNVLQYGVLLDVLGIDDAALNEGSAVTYTQDAMAAQRAISSGEAACAFVLNPTPVEQVLAVADAGGRMPQKSTYFYPKLPTGLVMRSLE